jgi:hypothetical protein
MFIGSDFSLLNLSQIINNIFFKGLKKLFLRKFKFK